MPSAELRECNTFQFNVTDTGTVDIDIFLKECESCADNSAHFDREQMFSKQSTFYEVENYIRGYVLLNTSIYDHITEVALRFSQIKNWSHL